MIEVTGEEMVKCAAVGCGKDAIAGFQEYIPAPEINNPYNVHLDPFPLSWCEEHENLLMSTISGKQGRALNPEQMDYIAKTLDHKASEP